MTPTPDAVSPVTERRLVSVLFADLVGFTGLSETRDSEEVRDLLSRYFEVCRTVVERYGGLVEKFIGDAVMAVWGTPVTNEDDAERSVRAAMDLVEAVAELGSDVEAPSLQARAGVLTGEATVNIGAQGQGMVAGDLVNTASRIQSAAEPGSVFVGDGTRRATDAAIVYADEGERELKGKSEPVRVWRALRVVATVGGTSRSTGLEAPFVGRDLELRLVKDLFHATAEEHRARLVSVVGIAGIGKSRLAWEFNKYIDGLVMPIRWHRGRCLAYGEGVTYWALAEMVRTRAGIVEGEDPESARPKLRQAVEETLPNPDESRWVEPRLAQLLGLQEHAARDRDDLFAAWRLFYERLADEMPTVMIFEDLQWADTSLLDFIEYLLDWSSGHAIYVVTLARPDLLDRRATWGAGRRNFTSIALEPLSPRAMEQLLTGLVPGLPDDLASRIMARAEGVPMYAVETVRMLLDRGALVQEGHEYRLTAAVEDLDVPETLHALIAARLDGLSTPERTLVQDAAILGKTFTRSALTALSDLSADELDPLLVSLVRKEVLSLQTDPLSPERGQYGFLQDLVRRVAYETLARKERRARHLRVADYLERAWGDEEEEIVEVVASHLLEAYRAAPDADDAEDIRRRARDMLIRAGNRAASLAANEEARRHLEAAIELTDDPATLAELHGRAGVTSWMAGHPDPATAHLEEAISLYESVGDAHAAARLTARLAEVDWNLSRTDAAVTRLDAAFQTLSREPPSEDLAVVAGQHGRFLILSGQQPEVAGERLELALTIAEALNLPEVFSHALNTKGMALQRRSRLQEARILLKGALDVALEHDLSEAALRAYNNLSVATAAADDFEADVETSRMAMEFARRVGHRFWELTFRFAPIGTMVMLGRWDEALALAAEARENEEFMQAPDWSSTLLLEEGEVHVHRGETVEAREALDRLGTLESSGDPSARMGYQWALGTVLMGEGAYRDALAAVEPGIATRESRGGLDWNVKRSLILGLEASLAMRDLARADELLAIVDTLPPGEISPLLRAQATRLRAGVAAAREDAGVEAGFKAAAGVFRELMAPFWLAVTQLEHAEWLVSEGRGADVEPLLSEASEVFDRLRAEPYLARAAAAMPASRAPTDAAV